VHQNLFPPFFALGRFTFFPTDKLRVYVDGIWRLKSRSCEEEFSPLLELSFLDDPSFHRCVIAPLIVVYYRGLSFGLRSAAPPTMIESAVHGAFYSPQASPNFFYPRQSKLQPFSYPIVLCLSVLSNAHLSRGIESPLPLPQYLEDLSPSPPLNPPEVLSILIMNRESLEKEVFRINPPPFRVEYTFRRGR